MKSRSYRCSSRTDSIEYLLLWIDFSVHNTEPSFVPGIIMVLMLCSKLWSFLVTATTGRHELKIWSTQTWSCLQTVMLLVPSTGVSSLDAIQDSYLQVGIDLSATYLVLCDGARKVLLHRYTANLTICGQTNFQFDCLRTGQFMEGNSFKVIFEATI